jgi:hypothetical protein
MRIHSESHQSKEITLKKKQFAVGAAVILGLGGVVFAQQSEFQAKIQEDLDGYKTQIIDNCGSPKSLTLKWNGKLAVNPRESEKPDYTAVSTLCTSALEGTSYACQDNKVFKAAIGKVSTITCTMGKGTIGYKLAGNALTFTIDPSYTKNNAAGQRDDLVKKMKKEIDN